MEKLTRIIKMLFKQNSNIVSFQKSEQMKNKSIKSVFQLFYFNINYTFIILFKGIYS